MIHVPVLGKRANALSKRCMCLKKVSSEHVQFVGDRRRVDAPGRQAPWRDRRLDFYDLVLSARQPSVPMGEFDGEWQLDAHTAISVSLAWDGRTRTRPWWSDAPVAPSAERTGAASLEVTLSTDGPATLLVMMDNDVLWQPLGSTTMPWCSPCRLKATPWDGDIFGRGLPTTGAFPTTSSFRWKASNVVSRKSSQLDEVGLARHPPCIS